MAEEPAAPPTEGARPSNQDAWQKTTEQNMMNSRNYVREMLSRLRQNDIEESENKAAAAEFAKLKAMEAKTVVMTRAAAHEKVIDTSFQCMQEIDDAKLQMEDAFIKLKHQRMQGFAALQVCQRRLELRDKRPPTEMFKDAVGDALLSERSKLEAARVEILGLESEAKKLIEELAGKRRFLSMDMGERRLEMAKDWSSLNVTVTVGPKDQEKEGHAGAEAPAAEAAHGAAPAAAHGAAPAAAHAAAPAAGPAAAPAPAAKPAAAAAEAPAAAPAPAEGAAGGAADGGAGAPPTAGGGGNKVDSKQLIADTQDLLSRCRTLRTKSFELIERAQGEAKEALLRVEDQLQRRCTDLAAKKKELERHALDVEAAMLAAERSLDRLKKRVDPKDKKRMEKLQADEAAFKMLKQSRQVLANDIRGKFVALEIDNLCRRVTPAKADSAKRQTQQMQTQQMQTQQMQTQQFARTSSAPTLRKKDPNATSQFGGTDSLDAISTRASTTSGKPPSPAGQSATLRAAGAAAGLH